MSSTFLQLKTFCRSLRGINPRSRSSSRTGSDLRDGEEGGAIKILVDGSKRYVYPPTGGVYDNMREPTEKLELDWVFGYAGKEMTPSGRNLWTLKSGAILYSVGAVAVIFMRSKGTGTDNQRHYMEHSEDISCMELHPEGHIVASGQKSGPTPESGAHVRIWIVESLKTLRVLGMGDCENSITSVSFSSLNNGDHVVAVDASKEFSLVVWEWDKEEVLGRVGIKPDKKKSKGGRQRLINGCNFHPLDNNLLITFGVDHLVFWTRRQDGFFERADVNTKARTITCVAFLDSGDLVAGDRDGMVSTYSVSDKGEYYMSHEFEAHAAGDGVNAITMLNDTTMITGGDKDRKIVAWDPIREYEKMAEATLPESMGSPRTIQPQKIGQKSGDTR
jgi:microtubule-associated protein-like 1/2